MARAALLAIRQSCAPTPAAGVLSGTLATTPPPAAPRATGSTLTQLFTSMSVTTRFGWNGEPLSVRVEREHPCGASIR
jgi:hypothetical protein